MAKVTYQKDGKKITGSGKHGIEAATAIAREASDKTLLKLAKLRMKKHMSDTMENDDNG